MSILNQNNESEGKGRGVPAPAQRTGLFVLLLLIVVEFAAILVINKNNFCYTLDDPYIHLALAENISRGHYGINMQEVSAPSSSIIWPLLLALFAGLPFFTFVPFCINVLAACGITWLFGRISELCIPSDVTRVQIKRSLLVVLLLVCSNTVGLVFTGMEHTVQLFITLLVIVGLIDEGKTGRVGMATWMGIVIGPLVRYECLTVSIAAAAILFFRRHRAGAVSACVGALVPLGLFSLFLNHLGLFPLPTSIMAKSAVVPGGGSSSLLSGMFSTLSTAVTSSRGLALLMLIGGLLWNTCVRKNSRNRMLSGGVAGAAVLHLLAGRYGSYNRYEMYIWGGGLVTLLYVYRHDLLRILFSSASSSPRRVGRCVGMVALLLGVCYPYVAAHATLPIASGNIYRQQYQMRRFVVRFYRRSVAVNDIGLVSYRSRHYVLDYAGLASHTALVHSREADKNSMWMDSLAQVKGVRFAMLYSEWFNPLPEGWKSLGKLRFSGPRITPAGREVTFYAMDQAAFHELVPLVDRFAATLPDGASFIRSQYMDGEKVAEVKTRSTHLVGVPGR